MKVRGNRAFGNASEGYDLSDFTSKVALEDSWAYRNDATGFIPGWRHSPGRGGAQAAAEGATVAMFRSTDTTAAEGPRSAAGLLPGTDYLTTGNGTGASMAGT